MQTFAETLADHHFEAEHPDKDRRGLSGFRYGFTLMMDQS